LLPILGKPVIWYVLEWLRHSGVDGISMCGNSNTAALRSCLGDGHALGARLDYVEEPVPRGSAGCLREVAVPSGVSEVIAVDGTLIADVDLPSLIAAHRRNKAGLTVVTGRDGRSRHANHLEPVGIYIISRPALELIPSATYQDIKEMWIPRLYQAGVKVVSHQVERSRYVRVLNGASYIAATSWAIRRTLARQSIDPSYRVVGQSLVHKTAKMAGSVRLVGPSVIGPDCRLKDSVTVVGPSCIGGRCRLERSCVVSHAILWNANEIGSGAIIDRSVLTSEAQVEPGMVIRDTIWGESLTLSGQSDDLFWALARPVITAPRSPVTHVKHVASRSLLVSAGEAWVPESLPKSVRA
jgi:mannose-1-phosphate guanylyltransferase